MLKTTLSALLIIGLSKSGMIWGAPFCLDSLRQFLSQNEKISILHDFGFGNFNFRTARTNAYITRLNATHKDYLVFDYQMTESHHVQFTSQRKEDKYLSGVSHYLHENAHSPVFGVHTLVYEQRFSGLELNDAELKTMAKGQDLLISQRFLSATDPQILYEVWQWLDQNAFDELQTLSQYILKSENPSDIQVIKEAQMLRFVDTKNTLEVQFTKGFPDEPKKFKVDVKLGDKQFETKIGVIFEDIDVVLAHNQMATPQMLAPGILPDSVYTYDGEIVNVNGTKRFRVSQAKTSYLGRRVFGSSFEEFIEFEVPAEHIDEVEFLGRLKRIKKLIPIDQEFRDLGGDQGLTFGQEIGVRLVFDDGTSAFALEFPREDSINGHFTFESLYLIVTKKYDWPRVDLN